MNAANVYDVCKNVIALKACIECDLFAHRNIQSENANF